MNIPSATAQGFMESARQQVKLRGFELALSCILFGFICFVLFDGMPFQKRDVQEILSRVDTGEGDTYRQIFYIVLLFSTSMLVFYRQGIRLFNAYPISIVIFLAWCILSVSWAVDPNISIRRIILSIFFIVIVANFITIVGIEQSLRVIYYTLAFSMIISIIGVFVIPGYARHPIGEVDPSLDGAWKGAFPHKNIAAMIAVMSFLFFFHAFLDGKRIRNFLLMIVTIVFLLGTGGKSGLGFLAPALFSGIIYRYFYPRKKGVFILLILACFGIAVAIALGLLFQDIIIATLENPLSFTGRVEIWQTLLKYVSNRPFIGSGFGSFWQIGAASPINKLASQKWLLEILHSHNGYMEMLVTTGIPGLIMAIIATIIVPMINFFKSKMRDYKVNALMVSMMTFCFSINMMETQLFARDRQVWLLFLVVIIGSRLMHKRDYRNVVVSKRALQAQSWIKSTA